MADHKESLVRIKRVIGRMARAGRMQLRVPLPVWDSTGELIGVALDCDRKMGPVDCLATATFTLNHKEQLSEDLIRAKAELAIAAINADVQVQIRPKREKAKGA